MNDKLTAMSAAITAWAFALTASAQGYGADLPVPRAESDWMTSGLAPLVLLIGLGVVVAAVAALVVIMMQRLPDRRRRGV